MGVLSRASEADSGTISSKSSDSRWLFPFRKFEEQLLENVLMSLTCHTPWSRRRKSPAPLQTCDFKDLSEGSDCQQRKWGGLSKNMGGLVTIVKQAFVDPQDKRSVRESRVKDECRIVACNEVVRAMLYRHPGGQLPDVLVSSLRTHFESLPLSYAKAGYASQQVFVHIRLLEQAAKGNLPVLHVQPAADCMSRSSNVSEFSSSSSSPTSSVWEEEERGVAEDTLEVAFACTSTLSKSALVWAFEHDLIHVKQAAVYDRKGLSLGVVQIYCSHERCQQETIRRVIKTAARKSRFSKLAIALCGCEVPGFSSPARKYASSSSSKKAEKSSSGTCPTDPAAEYKDRYCRIEAEFNFTSTSFLNQGYGYTSYRDSTSPAGRFRILISECGAPEIVSDEDELGRWLLNSTELIVGEETFSGGSGAVHKGTYKGESVTINEISGSKGASIIEGELRRDVLAIISCAHRNIVPFCGISVDARHSTYIAIVTKLMVNGSIRQMLDKRSGGLPLPLLLDFARDVAEGMRFLTDHGVAHRGLTSESVFVDSLGAARVGNLGVVRLLDGGCEPDPELSSRFWMAPDALGVDMESMALPGKSDVYNYGILLLEMLTGDFPFTSISAVGAVHGLRPAIPEDTLVPLKSLIEKCCSSDPLDRPSFSDVSQFLDLATQELLPGQEKR